MSDFDQYQDPLAELEINPGSDVFRPVAPRARPTGAALEWMRQAAQQFSAEPGVWLGLAALYTVVVLVVALIPLVNLSISALWPVVLGGLVLGMAARDQGGEMEIGHLLAGFSKRHFPALITIGAGYLLTVVAVCAAIGGMVGIGYLLVSVVYALIGGGAAVDTALSVVIAVSILLFALLFAAILILAATLVWFAVPLVVLRAYPAWEAVECSWRGIRLNGKPLLVFGLVVALLTLLSLPSLLLGFLLWLPLWWNTIYIAYKDIFTEPVADAAV